MAVQSITAKNDSKADFGHKKKKMNLKRSNSDVNDCWSNLPASCRLEKAKKLRPMKNGKQNIFEEVGDIMS